MTKGLATAPAHRSAPPSSRVCRLLVLRAPSPDLVGASFGLGTAVSRIGREVDDPGAIILDHESVSRAHAAVERRESGTVFDLRDLGAANGTFVNGARITTAELHDGDIVRIGPFLLLFEVLTLEDCEHLLEASDPASALVGESVAMRRLRAELERAAGTRDPILLLGESGVGKELVAGEAHRLSKRSGAFVPVNCAAIPEAIAESELFGHQQGAFTGASRASKGLFREAAGGTIFLDELGDLPAPLQAKLLRVLATGEVRGVGETKVEHVDARVIAATNVDVDRAVSEGGFRGDLYSRLAAFAVVVAPLRQRRQDIFILAERVAGIDGDRMTLEAAEALATYAWPYNVRELLDTLRVVDRKRPGIIDVYDLPSRMVAHVRDLPPRAVQLEDMPDALRVRRDIAPNEGDFKLVLRHFDGNVSRVAAFFGKDRRQIYRWAERFGLDLGNARED